eukprot:751514-Hanusia_phi.AAC.1
METPILNKFSLPPSLPNSLSLSTPSSQRKSGKRPLQRLLFTLALLAASSLWSLPSLATTGAASQTAEGASGIRKFVKFVLHLDTELVAIIAKYGTMTYAILWSIVFAETGETEEEEEEEGEGGARSGREGGSEEQERLRSFLHRIGRYAVPSGRFFAVCMWSTVRRAE